MPIYTLKNKKTQEQFDVQCSWQELQQVIDNDPDVVQELVPPKVISGRSGGLKVPDGFKDLQKRMKDNSGRGNTIRV